jgi:hypothetical protein
MPIYKNKREDGILLPGNMLQNVDQVHLNQEKRSWRKPSFHICKFVVSKIDGRTQVSLLFLLEA